MRKLRRLTEAEVIADFLRGEFFHQEYDADRAQFTPIVEHPDLTNATENEIRRVLLFRRRDTMWWELPEDRQWWEIEFDAEDVELVSVFPRAHWRKIARGNFSALHVAERVRQLREGGSDEFLSKISAIGSRLSTDLRQEELRKEDLREEGLRYDDMRQGMIILLGLDDRRPVTLLEGNHRFIAALLAGGPDLLRNTRMAAVFSPQMEKCCWYKTNFLTLARCLKNRIKHYWDRDTDLARLLAAGTARGGFEGYTGSAGPIKTKYVKSK
jgi:hypothetical protein